MSERENIVLKKAMEFALNIVDFTQIIRDDKRFGLAEQLFKSGTSIGANLYEAQSAESKADLSIN